MKLHTPVAIACALLLAIVLGVGFASGAEDTPPLYGDVDLDGRVTAADALVVVTAAAGKEIPASDRVMPNGDVDGNGRITARDALVILAYVVGDDVSAFRVGRPLPSLRLWTDSASVEVGAEVALRAKVTGLADTAVVWRSADSTVARVDSAGVAVGVQRGEVAVWATARADSTLADSLLLRVLPRTAIAIEGLPDTLTRESGDTVALSVVLRDGRGETFTAPVDWSSSDTTVALLEPAADDGSRRLITLTSGSTVVSARRDALVDSVLVTVHMATAPVADVGGVVESRTDSVRVDVPSGALATPVVVTVDPAPAGSYPENPYLLPDQVYDFGPDGTTFLEPVSLSLIVDPATVPGGRDLGDVRVYRQDGSFWREIDSSHVDPAAGVVYAMLSHFSVYGLLVRPPALTVTIGEHPATVPAGESLHLGVSVADVTPNTRSNQPVVWSSTDSSVAAVDGAGLVKSRLAGTVGIVARSGEVADTATLRVVALAPTHLWLSTGSGGSDPIGSTRSPTVRATDDLGNAVSGVRVAWKVTAGGGSLSVDSSTTNVNGVATTNWTLGTGAGANTLEVTAAGLDTVTYTATATAAAASAATSEVSADRDTLAADGVSTATVTVRLRDEFGNPLGSSGGTVTFAAPAQGSVGSVTDRKDGSYTAVYTAGDAVGAVTLTPALDGTPLTNAATLQLVPGDAVASASGLEIAGDSVTADGTSAATITVRLRDGQGRSTTSLPAGASLLASADNGAAVGPLADQGDGVYAASVTSTVSGPVQVTVTLGGSLVDGSPASIDFVSAGPAGLSVVAGDAQSGEVGTTLAIEPAVKVVDAGGNPLAGVAVEWAVVAGGGSVSADSSVTDGTGVATVAWTLGTSPGADTLSATIAGVTPVVFHATATGGVASGANSSLTAGTAALATGGTTALTLVLRDGFDNPIRGATVSSGATGGTLGTFTETGTGVYTATFTADTIPGSATATATVGSLVETASLTVSAGDAVAARSTLSLDPDTIVADGTSAATATVQLRDAYGNLTTILPDGVSIVRSATNGATIGAFVDQGGGRYTATSSSTTAGSSEISVTLGGSAVQGSPASLLFIPSAADSLSIVAGDAQTAAAGTAVATAPSVRVTDAHGNAVQGAVVKWTVLAGGGSVSADSSTSDASGAASVTWTLGSTAGLDSLRASVAGVDSVTFSATATAGAASKLVLTTQPSSSALSGVALIRQPVVQLRDAGGNAVSESGVQVTASIGSGGGTLGGTTAVTTDASGAATFTDLTLSSTSNGSHTLAFAATGLSTAVSDTINLTQAPSLTLSTVSVAADTLRYGSEDGALNSTTVTVQLKDSNGNDLATAGDSVVVSFPGGYVNTADETQSDTLTYLGGGAYRGRLTAPTKVGTQPIVASVNGQLLADTAHVEVVKTRFRFEAGDTSYYFPTTIGKYLIMPVQDADSLGAQGAGIYSITYRILATGYWPGQLGFGMGLAVYPLAYSSFHDLGSKDGELVFRGRDGLWAAEGVAYSSGATVLRDIGDELRIRVDTRDQSIRFFRKASGDSTFTDFTGTDIRTAFKNIYTNAAGSTKFAVSGICWQPCGLAVVQD